MPDLPVYAKKSFALDRLASGITSGACGALVISASEILYSFKGSSEAKALAIVASAGLLVPAGIFAGVALLGLLWLLGDKNEPSNWIRALSHKDNPSMSGRIATMSLAVLLALPLFQRVTFHFMTDYRHKGLAALALTISIALLSCIFAIAVNRAASLVSRIAERLGAKFSVFRMPLAALLFSSIVWLIAIVPPFVQGLEADGLFGFIGLLRKDGLGAGPLVSILALVSVTGIVLRILLSKRPRHLIRFATVCTVLGAAGPIMAGIVVEKNPSTLEALDSCRGMILPLSKLGRSLSDGDKDGHGRWLGGKDCNDQNKDIYPGAREIPNNGIDEDCSNGDFDLKSLDVKEELANPAAEEALKRPEFPEDVSLLMITVDSLRWDAPGFMGYKRNITPNLDRIAAKGIVYERAYALGSYTAQAIPPLLTGKYASELIRNDRHETKVSKKEDFAAEIICGEKIKCAAFLSHFLFEPDYGWNQGFGDWKIVGAEPDGPGHIDSKYNSHIVTSQAIQWLGNPENTKGRFWLWLHYMDPHREYVEHQGFAKFGSDRRSQYDHEVLFADHHIGKLLDYFERLPAAQRTIVIVTSDHGEAFNEHGRWCHGMELWEEIIRVPLIVAGPDIRAKRIRRQTSQIDLFPTLLELFGKPVKNGTHGRSLIPDWTEGQELDERPVFVDQAKNPYYETRRAFIHKGWKLHHLPDFGTYRFFELTNDYERGNSLLEEKPEEFAAIKAAYELFSAAQFKPIPPVKFHGKDLSDMDAP